VGAFKKGGCIGSLVWGVQEAGSYRIAANRNLKSEGGESFASPAGFNLEGGVNLDTLYRGPCEWTSDIRGGLEVTTAATKRKGNVPKVLQATPPPVLPATKKKRQGRSDMGCSKAI